MLPNDYYAALARQAQNDVHGSGLVGGDFDGGYMGQNLYRKKIKDSFLRRNYYNKPPSERDTKEEVIARLNAKVARYGERHDLGEYSGYKNSKKQRKNARRLAENPPMDDPVNRAKAAHTRAWRKGMDEEEKAHDIWWLRNYKSYMRHGIDPEVIKGLIGPRIPGPAGRVKPKKASDYPVGKRKKTKKKKTKKRLFIGVPKKKKRTRIVVRSGGGLVGGGFESGSDDSDSSNSDSDDSDDSSEEEDSE